LKVALVCSAFPVTSETFVIRHVVGLMEAGVDLTVITPQAGDAWANMAEHLQEEVRRRLRIVDPSIAPGWRQLLRDLPRSSAALKEVGHYLLHLVGLRRPELGNYDAILAHFGPVGHFALRLRRRGHIAGPIATIFHGYEMSMHATVQASMPSYKQVFRETEALLPISAFWAQRLREWGADPAKIRVLHMGSDVPAGATPAIDRPLGRPLKILTVGRLTEKKGIAYAIEAVRQCGAEAELEIIGAGPLDAELRAHAERTPGRNPISFRGLAPHREVLAALDRSDIFLLPSVTAADGDMEGIPVVLMEAMLHGCVVVSTRHSGIPELIENGVSGVLVSERSTAEIAGALEALAGGDYDLGAMRRHAIETVESGFNNATLDRELLSILQQLASRQPIGG
jgi:colanic acid/amylovoran biosynthesis glycosyltransferase